MSCERVGLDRGVWVGGWVGGWQRPYFAVEILKEISFGVLVLAQHARVQVKAVSRRGQVYVTNPSDAQKAVKRTHTQRERESVCACVLDGF